MKNLNKILYSFALIFAVVIFMSNESLATVYDISAPLQGTQEVPPSGTTALGAITGTYDDATMTITFDLLFTGLSAPTVNAHFHAPAPRGVNAPVVIGFIPDGFPIGVTSGAFSHSYILTAVQNTQILSGLFYVNIHTSAFPGGEIRGQLDGENTLPVELSSFTSMILRNSVTLNWTTVSETNNAGFDIERSSAANEWTKVGHVQGNGNSAVSNSYAFTDRGLAIGSYRYRLKQIDFNGNFEYFALNNEANIGTPSEYRLSQNYPNPFNPTTKIDYDLPYDGNVSIMLYDVSGREVATLVNEVKSAGYNSITFNASALTSGIYYYKITANNFAATKKMMLVK